MHTHDIFGCPDDPMDDGEPVDIIKLIAQIDEMLLQEPDEGPF